MSRKILIVEKSDAELTKLLKKDGTYCFEGIFTKFDTMNRNKRIYEKSNFMPHVNSLNQKIKTEGLLGELDHPTDMSVRLQCVSHIIEELKFDETKNAIVGKVTLLDTQKGKDAKAIVDAGIPLHVSSRANGEITNEGKVKINELVTYDLVASPGFAEAKLTRIAENYGSDFALNINSIVKKTQYSNNPNLKLINEEFNLDKDQNIEIYEILNEKKETLMESKTLDFVKKNDLQKYSLYLQEQFTTIQKELKHKKYVTRDELDNYSNHIKESFDKITDILENKNDYKNVGLFQKHSNSIQEKLDSLDIDSTYASKNEIETYSKYLSEEIEKIENNIINRLNKTEQSIDKISKDSKNQKEYVEYLRTGMDALSNHNDYIVEQLEGVKNYAEYIAKNVSETINEKEEKLDKLVKYTEYLAKKLNESISYSEYIGEKGNKVAEYLDYLGGNVNKIAEYNQYMSEYVKENLDTKGNKGQKVVEHNVTKILENTKKSYNDNYKDSITSKIDELIRGVKNVSESKNKYNVKPDYFIDFLEIEQIKEWAKMSSSDKQMLIEAYNKTIVSNEEQAMQVWKKIVAEQNFGELHYIKNMPSEYVNLWEALTPTEQNFIKIQAEGYNLKTPYLIKNFWDTRDLSKAKRIIESKNKNLRTVSNEMFGYSVDKVSLIERTKKSLGR